MRCEFLPISDLTASDVAAWEQLGRTAVVPNPFLEPDFVLPATRAWGATDVQLLVVRNDADAEWRAALPVRSVSSWRGVPGRCLVSWRHDYCYLGTPLVTSDEPHTILATLIRGGLQAPEGAGGFVLDWLSFDGGLSEPLAAVLRSEARPVVIEEFERAALYRRPSNDYLEQTMGAGTRKRYRRKLRLLEREVGEVTVHDRSDHPAAYECFLELELSGWRGREEWRTAMAARPGHAAFFTELCHRFARSGRLQLLSLESEQHTLAMKSDLTAGDAMFFFKQAFNEEFSQSSPGVQLEFANVERFHAGGWAIFDSCASPNNALYNKLWPERRRLRSVVATRPGASGALAYAKWRTAVGGRRVGHRLKQTMSRSHGD